MNHKFLFLPCAALLLFACNEQSDPFPDTAEKPAAEEVVIKGTFVSEKDAVNVAELFFRSQTDKGIMTKSQAGLLTSPASIEAVKEDAGTPLMYVLNYPEGGFALISATRDYAPILAYSDEGSFELTSDMGPVAIWMEEATVAIKESETLPVEEKAAMRRMWNKFEQGDVQLPTVSTKSVNSMSAAYEERASELYWLYGPSGWSQVVSLAYAYPYVGTNYNYLCSLAEEYGSPPEYTIVVLKSVCQQQQVGPLLTTLWHQGPPFNSISYPNNEHPLGCGVVAIAQAMNFHEHPRTLHWKGRFINWGVFGDVPYLMDYVKSVSDSHPVPFVPGQSYTFPWKIDDTFRDFHYTVSKKSHFSHDVKMDILRQRPVVMFGSHTSAFPSRSHYWVCDGYKNTEFTDSYFVEFIHPGTFTYSSKGHSSATEPWTVRIEYPYYHMNWGWINGENNAWFFNNNVNPDYNYQYLRENYYVHP